MSTFATYLSDWLAPKSMPASRPNAVIVAVFGVLLAIAWLMPAWLLASAGVTLAKALAVLGCIVLLRGGLVSFGQGLYFCLGGYAVGVLDMLGVSDLLLRVVAAALASLAIAVPAGFLVRRYRGLFFAMLSLALSMLLWGLLVRNHRFGSTDGFNVSPTSLLGSVLDGATAQRTLYIAAVVMACACCLAVTKYFASIAGRMALALKDNELRIGFLGQSASVLVHVEYTVAAVLTGTAGGLVAMMSGHIDPDMAYWTTSGDFVFITILGGAGHVLAAVLGAGVFELVHTAALWLAPGTWRLLLGAVLLLLILRLPNGLWSLFARKP